MSALKPFIPPASLKVLCLEGTGVALGNLMTEIPGRTFRPDDEDCDL